MSETISPPVPMVTIDEGLAPCVDVQVDDTIVGGYLAMRGLSPEAIAETAINFTTERSRWAYITGMHHGSGRLSVRPLVALRYIMQTKLTSQESLDIRTPSPRLDDLMTESLSKTLFHELEHRIDDYYQIPERYRIPKDIHLARCLGLIGQVGAAIPSIHNTALGMTGGEVSAQETLLTAIGSAAVFLAGFGAQRHLKWVAYRATASEIRARQQGEANVIPGSLHATVHSTNYNAIPRPKRRKRAASVS